MQHEQRPLIWTDDDAVVLDTAMHRRMSRLGLPVLIVAPEPDTGLREADLAKIDAFLTRDHAADPAGQLVP